MGRRNRRWRRGLARLIAAAKFAAPLWASAGPLPAQSVIAIPGKPNLLIGAYNVGDLGYMEKEFFISGEAATYVAGTPLATDGRWTVSPVAKATYTTRIVVLRPTNGSKFNGTVVVEWLNVSGGLDAPADWFMAHRELVRTGYAYVGVSAQKVGIAGGKSLGMDMSLKKVNPARYARLAHPGDAFAFDIFSQAGRLVRDGGANGILGGLVAKRVLAAGESQSAHFLTTYVNAIDPLAKVYDGFLIHSRFSGSAPLDGSSMMGQANAAMPSTVLFRPNLRVPVMTFVTEPDLIGTARSGYYAARQPDTARLRVWEIPGTAHADTYTVQVAPIDTGLAPIEKLAAAYTPADAMMGAKLAKPINAAPQHHYVLEAAIAGLDRWVRTGKAPAKGPRIELSTNEPSQAVRDTNGMAVGGIRTPWVDVPVARNSGTGNAGSVMASLFGSSEAFDTATLARLYPGGRVEYLAKFTAALDRSIRSGFILPADREEILGLAAAMYPHPH
uniref:alpha/beta hydrolase domain-containing protein n=1 Tax=uncultured Sphingomonas sp. TaxID=158754 RepID=UPI0035CA33D2